MTSRKKSGWIAGVGVGAAAAAALRKRWSRTPDALPPVASPLVEIPVGVAGEFLDHLAAAIRIPTVSDSTEDGVFERFRSFLAETYPLTHERLELTIIGDHTLLFRWEGSDAAAKPFLLMAHQDVVPVEEGTEEDWEQEPFGGQIADGFLWGRGALDDKGSLVAIFEAVEALLSEGFVPGPTVYLLFGHDEEIGGAHGAAIAADHLGGEGVRLSFVLDEGGAVVHEVFPGVPPLALVGLGEKASLDVEIVAEGAGGHSSMPPEHTAIGLVAAAVKAIEERPMPARLDAQKPLLTALAASMAGVRGALLRNREWTGRFVERRLAADPYTNALIRTTSAATVIRGGVKSNVLPQEASATINFRILPGDSGAEVLDHVRSVVGDRVRIRATDFGARSDPPPVSSTNTSAFQAIVETIESTFPEATLAPWILPGATDSRYLAPIADGVYRFAPFSVSRDDFGRIHGTGERVAVGDAAGAVSFYRRLIVRAGSRA